MLGDKAQSFMETLRRVWAIGLVDNHTAAARLAANVMSLWDINSSIIILQRPDSPLALKHHFFSEKSLFRYVFSSRFLFYGLIYCSMPVKRKITKSHGVFFITFTCCEWLPLIELTKSYDLVYKWFDYLKTWGHHIIGYVIMPNHIHSLFAFRNTGQSINTIIGNGKRIMANGIVRRLKQQKQDKLLTRLNLLVTAKDRERNKQHEIWEDSFDWKECNSIEFILQKLNYIHCNPCKGRWDLAPSPEEYIHSSGMFYLSGEHSAYPVTHYMQLDDIDLSKPLVIY